MIREIKYHNYIVRYKENQAIAFHSVYRDRSKKFESLGEAIKWIDGFFIGSKNWDNVSKCKIAFNVDFLRVITDENTEFNFDIEAKDDVLYLSMDKSGKFRSRDKGVKSIGSRWEGGTDHIKNIGLTLNSRFTVSPHGNKFKLVFDSNIQEGDRVRLKEPAVLVYAG